MKMQKQFTEYTRKNKEPTKERQGKDSNGLIREKTQIINLKMAIALINLPVWTKMPFIKNHNFQEIFKINGILWAKMNVTS